MKTTTTTTTTTKRTTSPSSVLLGQVGHQTRQELIIASNQAQASPGPNSCGDRRAGRGIVTVRRFQPFRFDGVLQLAGATASACRRLAHSFSFEKLFEDAHDFLSVPPERAR